MCSFLIATKVLTFSPDIRLFKANFAIIKILIFILRFLFILNKSVQYYVFNLYLHHCLQTVIKSITTIDLKFKIVVFKNLQSFEKK